MPALFKQRLIVLPTLWGLLLIITIVSGGITLALKNMAIYLSKNQPVNAHYLVVEGWLTEPALLQSVEIFNSGAYEKLITTGGPDTSKVKPDYKSYADKSAAFILSIGFDRDKIVVIPTPASAQDRTYLSAVMVRNWFEENEIEPAFNIISGDVHSRRTHALYTRAFKPNSHIGIIAIESLNYDKYRWWKTSSGAKSVLTEAIGLIWITCCFNPGEKYSHQEKWGEHIPLP